MDVSQKKETAAEGAEAGIVTALLFQECWRLNYISRRDKDNPQQFCQAFGEQAYKDLKRRLTMQTLPYDTIDMRQYEIHIILCQVVEGSALRENITQKSVILLHAGFFAGVIGIAEEQMRFRLAFEIIFKGSNVIELRPIVRENNRHDIPKEEARTSKPVLQGLNCSRG